MHTLLAALHTLGTKPLAVSLVAQFVVLGVSLKRKENPQVRQSLTLIVALALVTYSISLRLPSPYNLKADLLGTVAAFLFVVPAVQALLKLRAKAKTDA